MADFTTKWLRGTIATLLSAGLNSLANNGLALSSAFDNGTALDLQGELELVVTYGSAPTANTGCAVWLLRNVDGTNYEDGSDSVTPARAPDLVFPLRAVTTGQRIILPVTIPPGSWKALLKNDGTGQAMAASGNTLKLRPLTYQHTEQS